MNSVNEPMRGERKTTMSSKEILNLMNSFDDMSYESMTEAITLKNLFWQLYDTTGSNTDDLIRLCSFIYNAGIIKGIRQERKKRKGAAI